MDANEVQRWWDKVWGNLVMPHHHVVIKTDGHLSYSDGLSRTGAQGYAADLIARLSGQPEAELESVWIAEGDPKTCPLAHGDDAEGDSQAATEFLEQVPQQPPCWMKP